MNRSLVFFLCALGVGFLAGRWTGPAHVPPTPPVENPAVQRSDETESLLKKGLAEIDHLGTNEEKQMRAFALLEQLLKVYMIDVSLRLQKPTPPAQAEVPVVTPAATLAPPPKPTEPETMPAQLPDPKDRLAWERLRGRVQVQIVNAEDRRDLTRALIDLAKTDFEPNYRQASEPTLEQRRSLIGSYSGVATVADGKRWPVSIEIQISPRSTAQNETYKYTIDIRPGGESRSRTSGEGNLKDFAVGKGEAAPLYIETGDFVMELYTSPAAEGLAGLLHQRKGRGPYSPIGSLQLRKR